MLGHRLRGLSLDRPVLRGSAQNPDVFFQAREAANPFYDALPGVVQEVMGELAARTGRAYHLVDYTGAPDAERVVIIMGSGAGAVEETVAELVRRGERVGLLTVRLFRPFPGAELATALPDTVRRIAVLDRTKEPGAIGEPLYLDVVAALAEQGRGDVAVIGGRYGLSSKEFTPAMVKGVYDELRRPHPRRRITVGIVDDVTRSSVEPDREFRVPTRAVQAVFYGLGSDGTVGANKFGIKIIGEQTDLYAQGYFVYDSRKAGSVTVSHLRFGPDPIRSTYLVDAADFVACHQFGLLERMKVLDVARPGDRRTVLPRGHRLLPDPGVRRCRAVGSYQADHGGQAGLGIPVIASINGTTPGGWVYYAQALEEAGADAIELNLYAVPADPERSGAEVEAGYLDVVHQVRAAIDTPLAVKLSPYLSATAHFARRVVDAGADGLVLFNRFYQPDIDLDTLDVLPRVELSHPRELRLPLRWLAILRPQLPGTSLAATTGVHSGLDAAKALCVGADNINYRVRVAHTSRSGVPPTARYDLWERVNNNDGSWRPQIIYAVQDRVVHYGKLYECRHVHQAIPDRTPPFHPELWEPIPLTAKAQLVKFCDPNDPEEAGFFNIGQNGTEEQAREVLAAALAVCHRVDPMPSAGITENAVMFEVPDGSSFRNTPTSGTAYYETMSNLLSITLPSTLYPGQSVTVNGRTMRPGRNYPLPPMRNEGYIIKVTGGAIFAAR